jgi:hypothetical protein
MVNPLALSQPSQNPGLFALTIGRDQHGYGSADGFLRGVAKQPLGALVPTGDNSVEVLGDDGVVGRIHDCRHEALRLTHLLDRLF